MIIAKVIGNVWATRKDEQLSGFKFMVVQPLNYVGQKHKNSTFVAVDQIGAGVGETVLIVQGSSARRSVEKENLPIDASIVGIIDKVEVGKEVMEE
jgi:ethanolamine utilization protein EutN